MRGLKRGRGICLRVPASGIILLEQKGVYFGDAEFYGVLNELNELVPVLPLFFADVGFGREREGEDEERESESRKRK